MTNRRKNISLTLYIAIISCFGGSVWKTKHQEIPKSNIKDSGMVSINLDFLKDKGKVLVMNMKCAVVGIDNTPYYLCATPFFSKDDLPSNIRKGICDVKMLVLQSTFSSDPILKEYAPLPNWIADLKKIKYLRFDHIDVDNLYILRQLPVEHLIFANIKLSNESKLIAAIKQLKYLKYLAYDQSLSESIRKSIKSSCPKLILFPEADYYKMKLYSDL